jgi:hypothetical protein
VLHLCTVKGLLTRAVVGPSISRAEWHISDTNGTEHSTEDKTWAMSQVIAMMGSRGFKPARDKHAIQSGGGPITLMRMSINRHTTIPAKERSQIRAMVRQLEMQFNRGDVGVEFRLAMDSVNGKVGKLRRLHPAEGEKLRERLHKVRSAANALPFSTAQAELASVDWGDQDAPPF